MSKPTLDKERLLDFMTKRLESLDEMVVRDFSGGLQNRWFEYREVKYWKEAIERGEFDSEKFGTDTENLVQKGS